jgi:hypothetical protein
MDELTLCLLLLANVGTLLLGTLLGPFAHLLAPGHRGRIRRVASGLLGLLVDWLGYFFLARWGDAGSLQPDTQAFRVEGAITASVIVSIFFFRSEAWLSQRWRARFTSKTDAWAIAALFLTCLLVVGLTVVLNREYGQLLLRRWSVDSGVS